MRSVQNMRNSEYCATQILYGTDKSVPYDKTPKGEKNEKNHNFTHHSFSINTTFCR